VLLEVVKGTILCVVRTIDGHTTSGMLRDPPHGHYLVFMVQRLVIMSRSVIITYHMRNYQVKEPEGLWHAGYIYRGL